MNCPGPHPEGPRPVELGEFCTAHYAQLRRNPKRPLRPLRSTDSPKQEHVTFRCPRELKGAIERAAEGAGLDMGEWLRRVAAKAIGSRK